MIFFETLKACNATFSLRAKGNNIACYEIEQIRYAAGRLKRENISEGSIEMTGCFRVFLQRERNFEFITEDNKIIYGKVAKYVRDSEKINTDFLEKNVRVKFHTRKLGKGKPRYALFSMDDICI